MQKCGTTIAGYLIKAQSPLCFCVSHCCWLNFTGFLLLIDRFLLIWFYKGAFTLVVYHSLHASIWSTFCSYFDYGCNQSLWHHLTLTWFFTWACTEVQPPPYAECWSRIFGSKECPAPRFLQCAESWHPCAPFVMHEPETSAALYQVKAPQGVCWGETFSFLSTTSCGVV